MFKKFKKEMDEFLEVGLLSQICVFFIVDIYNNIKKGVSSLLIIIY